MTGYLLDTNVFIQAAGDPDRDTLGTYSMLEFPGFWDWLRLQAEAGVVASVDAVRLEVMTDRLALWCDSMPAETFHAETEVVRASRTEIVSWINDHPVYSEAAKRKFMSGADCSLIATAHVSGRTVVTYETPEPRSKRSIKIPDVCIEFGIECIYPAEMLSRERARFVLDPQVRALLSQR